MDDTRGTDRLVGIATVAIVHLLLAWLLVHAGAVRLPQPIVVDTVALQATWITRAPDLPDRPRLATARPESPVTPAARPARRRATKAPATPPIADPAPRSAMPSDTASPDAGWPATQNAPLQLPARPAAESDFAPTPLRDRIATLPGRPTNRFRMRDPVTPAAVVESIGRLFGGGPSDPCPQLREGIAGLATQGDSAALREALERRRSHCP